MGSHAEEKSGMGKADYSTTGSSGYEIPNIVYDDPNSHKLRVITIGAGFCGIEMAYYIQKYCQNVEHVVFEKNHDIGGTWLENRYPNCACDVPSHCYTYNFALNPDWPHLFSPAAEVWAYLDRVCRVFDLRKYMQFNVRVVRAVWDESRGKWVLTMRRTSARDVDVPDGPENGGGGSEEEFTDECDLLLYATGVLNNAKMLDVPGLDSFKGRVLHTARWPKDYGKEQWKEENVAVVGSGASSLQAVAGMQPWTKHMDIFVRTGVWFVHYGPITGDNKAYTETERENFRKNPAALVAHAREMENMVNGYGDLMYHGSETQEESKRVFRELMAETLKDPRLIEGFTPKFDIGCRRITPGDPYMRAVRESNVDVHFTGVERVTPEGVVGQDGIERRVDTIVCATGFDTSFKPRFAIIGKDGVDLRDKWAKVPDGYLGLGAPGMPNFIIFMGPAWPIENGSVAAPAMSVCQYALQVIQKMQRDHIKSWTPKQSVVDQFNDHAQEWYKYSVWGTDCRAWYKNNETGRVNAIWPGSSLHYMDAIKTPRFEDFDIAYHNKNMWAILGMGKSMKNVTGDFCPYFKLENVDTKWLDSWD